MNARRFDWHVLLPRVPEPATDHWLVLGGSAEDARLPIDLEMARSVGTSPGSSGSADVVALLVGTTVSIERAASSLAAGGCLYVEVDRSLPRGLIRTPGRVARSLRRRGLTPVAMYWVGPDFATANRWLPLDLAGPTAWYLSAMGSPSGRVRSFVRRALGALLRGPWSVAPFVPRFAVVAVAGPAPDDPRPNVLRQPALAPIRRAAVGAPIQVTGGQEDWSRITLLTFGRSGRRPMAVVKIARRSPFDEATRREHATLLDLRTRVDPDLLETIPLPIALVDAGPRAALVQSALTGSSALARTRASHDPRKPVTRDFGLVCDWLIAFHGQTGRQRAMPRSSAWSTHIDGPMKRFMTCFDEELEIARLLERTRVHLASLEKGIPIALMHMDLGPWNVLVDGDRIRVIDWEVARDGPIYTDLVYAAIHWTLATLGPASEAVRRQHVRRLLTGRDTDGSESPFGTLLDRYATALALDPRSRNGLTVLALVLQALDRHDRESVLGTTAHDRGGDRYLEHLRDLADGGERWVSA